MMIIMMIDDDVDDDDYLDNGSDRNDVDVCDSVVFTIMIVTSLLLISIISPTYLIISAVSVTLPISPGYPIFSYSLYQPISISFSRHYPILPTSLFYSIISINLCKECRESHLCPRSECVATRATQ